MHVRARTCCSMITITGELCDPWVSSARLVKSSMISPNSEKGFSHSTNLISIFHGAKSAPHTLQRIAADRDVASDFRVHSQERRQGTFWSVATDLAAANIAIRARRRRIRGAIDDVCFIFRHEI